jgi:hypothetical protein
MTTRATHRVSESKYTASATRLAWCALTVPSAADRFGAIAASGDMLRSVLRASIVLSMVLSLACDDERPPPDRGIPLASAPATPTTGPDVFERPRPDPRVTPSDPFAPRPRSERVLVETPGTPATAPASESALVAELRAAAGTPEGCGEVPTLEGELRIPLRATVASNGFVTAASVGGNLPGAVRVCMEDRIERHRFASAPSGLPQSVQAELVLDARRTTMQETTVREERTGSWGTGFELQPGQTAAGSPAREITPAPGAREIAPAAGAREIAPAPGAQEIGGPSGVTIMGPTGRAIGD